MNDDAQEVDRLGPLLLQCEKRPFLHLFGVLSGGWWLNLANLLVTIPFFGILCAGGIGYALGLPKGFVFKSLAGMMTFVVPTLLFYIAYVVYLSQIYFGVKRSRLDLFENGFFIRAFRFPFTRDIELNCSFADLSELRLGYEETNVTLVRLRQVAKRFDREACTLADFATDVGLTLVFNDGSKRSLPAVLYVYTEESVNEFIKYAQDRHEHLLVRPANSGGGWKV